MSALIPAMRQRPPLVDEGDVEGVLIPEKQVIAMRVENVEQLFGHFILATLRQIPNQHAAVEIGLAA